MNLNSQRITVLIKTRAVKVAEFSLRGYTDSEGIRGYTDTEGIRGYTDTEGIYTYTEFRVYNCTQVFKTRHYFHKLLVNC